MRLRCKKNELVNALNKVGDIASEKTPNLLLSYLLLQTVGNKLRLMATDLEVGIETFVELQVEEEGEVACPAKKFESLITELPADDIAIDTQKNNSILINSGSSHFRLMGIGTDKFPILPEIKDEVRVELDGKDFREIIKHSFFAMSLDERRTALNGLCFKISEGVLKIVAADGRRMAYTCRNTDAKGPAIEVLVPAGTVRKLEHVIEEGPLKILFSEKQIVFCSGQTRFVSRLTEGEFPDYEMIIPKTLKSKISFNRGALLSVLKRMALLTGDKANAVKLDIGKKKIIFSIENPELGEGREEMACDDCKAESMTILFNPHYIIDFLKNNTAESVDFQFNEAGTPVIFKPDTDENYIYFLMPIKV